VILEVHLCMVLRVFITARFGYEVQSTDDFVFWFILSNSTFKGYFHTQDTGTKWDMG